MKKGKLIIIEGSDGSGKATQARKLYDKLLSEGKKVKLISFPDYESNSSALVKMYLAGEFGENPNDVNTYAASTFYAVDRFASYKSKWEEFYLSGGIIISDRYTTSNMVHQASKISNKEEKDEYLDWLWNLEFNLYGLPVPNKVIFLDVYPETSRELMKDRLNKITNEKTKDIHESDKSFLRSSYENALYIADKYNWERLDCNGEQGILDIGTIHKAVYNAVREVLKAD